MDDMKEKIYLLALDIIKSRKIPFICEALRASYKEYTGVKDRLSNEELKELFSEFFDLYDGTYWYYSVNKFMLSVDQHDIHRCWWHYRLIEPREMIIKLILSRGCR